MIQIFGKFVFGIALSLTIGLLLYLLPVTAQEPNTAKVVLDGYPIFSVYNSGGYAAQERAQEASTILQETVNQGDFPVFISVDDSNKILPVITVNDNHLLTVTYNDIPRGRNAIIQANIWKDRLERAIARAEYQRTLPYLRQAGSSSLIAFILMLGLFWLLKKIWQELLRPWLNNKTRDSNNPKVLLIAIYILVLTSRIAVGIFGLNFILNQFPQTRQWYYYFTNILINSIFYDAFSIAGEFYSVGDLFILFALLITLVFLGQKLKIFIKNRFLNLTSLDRPTKETVAIIANYIFIFIAGIIVMQIWGLDISSLTVFAGVLGVGVALGVQGIAKEFISGLLLIFERPVKVGDFVTIGDFMGTVEKMSFRSTEIRTLDNISVILPNSRFLESEVINWDHTTSVSRLTIPVGVAYGSDLTAVRKALMEAAKGDMDILSDPQPKVLFKGFGDNSLDFELLIWIKEPRKQFQIKSDIYFRIEALLRHRQIEIPFPQRDIHIKSDELVDSISRLSKNLAKWLDTQSF